MKIVSINMADYGSTGRIVRGIATCAQVAGMKYYRAFPWNPNADAVDTGSSIVIGNRFTMAVNKRMGYITGYQNCFSFFATLSLLRKFDAMKPDILHLHNLHNNFVNICLLFSYIKKHHISVVWTLHDCWAFTGQCPHFTTVKCEKWRTGCYDCPQYRQYPEAYVDRTKAMWTWKKKWFTGVEQMTIITPSRWLADLVRQSFLKEYPVRVLNNGISLSVFKPTLSDIREKIDLTGKYIVLGVAFGWNRRKGLDIFIRMAKRLDEKYQIILVGTDDEVDKQLPENILSVHRTQNQQELAEFYTAANVFVNPTRQENFPTVNIEALACGTPVLTFRTGGSPEIIDETCGSVVECDDVDAMEQEIIRICEAKPYSESDCMKRASKFDMNERFKEYTSLYENITRYAGKERSYDKKYKEKSIK